MSPNKPSSLRFDRRTKSWVEQPKTWLQDLNEKSDDFHAGLIVGVGVGGFLSCIVVGLATLTSLL